MGLGAMSHCRRRFEGIGAAALRGRISPEMDLGDLSFLGCTTALESSCSALCRSCVSLGVAMIQRVRVFEEFNMFAITLQKLELNGFTSAMGNG